jgi:hypothetical protein
MGRQDRRQLLIRCIKYSSNSGRAEVEIAKIPRQTPLDVEKEHLPLLLRENNMANPYRGYPQAGPRPQGQPRRGPRE